MRSQCCLPVAGCRDQGVKWLLKGKTQPGKKRWFDDRSAMGGLQDRDFFISAMSVQSF
jgi:hypothetical protein